ncbi:hypothetical protein ACWV26_02140 [Rummeliibacillus sp. JY-2-4R]
MWKKSSAILLFSALLLVGCSSNKAYEGTRTETPMEDVNRHVNEGVTDDGITNDGVNNGMNNGTNNVERGASDVTEDVKEGINKVLPGTPATPAPTTPAPGTHDKTIVDDNIGNGAALPHDRDDNK